eukprot:4130956-Prymnesium_polylepis.1
MELDVDRDDAAIPVLVDPLQIHPAAHEAEAPRNLVVDDAEVGRRHPPHLRPLGGRGHLARRNTLGRARVAHRSAGSVGARAVRCGARARVVLHISSRFY